MENTYEALQYTGTVKQKLKKAWTTDATKFNYKITLATLGNQLVLGCNEETFDKFEEGEVVSLPIGFTLKEATDKNKAWLSWYIKDSEIVSE